MNTNIELYKNRTIGERFAAASDFIRQNWKILFKNLLYIGLPLAILQGFFMQTYMEEVMNMMLASDFSESAIFAYAGLALTSILFSLFFYSIIGAILNKYKKGTLSEETNWSDLKGTVFSFAGKIFIQGLFLFLAILLVSLVFGVIVGFLAFAAGSVFTSVIIFLGIVVLGAFILPLFVLMPYPIFFENASAWQALKKGIRLGFRYWGSTFLTAFLGGLILGIVYYIFLMPYAIYMVVSDGDAGFIAYVLAIFSSLVLAVVLPVYIVFLALQYTSVTETEEGVSLQNDIEKFDNL